MKHKKLLNEKNLLKAKAMETNVVLPCGKYSHSANLTQQLCELDSLTEKMFEKLSKQADSFGFGDSYEEICELLKYYNDYKKKSSRALSTGKDWDDCGEPAKQKPPKKERAELPTRIFGMTWMELEKKQGGKLTKSY